MLDLLCSWLLFYKKEKKEWFDSIKLLAGWLCCHSEQIVLEWTALEGGLLITKSNLTKRKNPSGGFSETKDPLIDLYRERERDGPCIDKSSTRSQQQQQPGVGSKTYPPLSLLVFREKREFWDDWLQPLGDSSAGGRARRRSTSLAPFGSWLPSSSSFIFLDFISTLFYFSGRVHFLVVIRWRTGLHYIWSSTRFLSVLYYKIDLRRRRGGKRESRLFRIGPMHLTRWSLVFLSFFLPPVELHRRPSHLFCYALFAFFPPIVVEIHQSLLGWPFSTANSNFSLGNNARAHDDRNLVGGPHPSLTSRKMMHAPPRSISNFFFNKMHLSPSSCFFVRAPSFHPNNRPWKYYQHKRI